MKSRRDITLGEMQDECKKYWNNGNLGSCGKCQYMSICCHYEDYAPAKLNLTDPPRFNEAQMAFWRGWYGIGAVFAHRSDATNSSRCVHIRDAEYNYLGYLQIEYDALPIKCGETIDLAELLGKDGESK